MANSHVVVNGSVVRLQIYYQYYTYRELFNGVFSISEYRVKHTRSRRDISFGNTKQ